MGNETQHIPMPEDPKNERKDENTSSNNPVAKVADPVGKGLESGLRPVGAGLEKITGPLGNAVGGITRPALGPLMGNKDEKMEIVGGENKDSYRTKDEKIAGKEQTGENPLGLDQTGRWGFQDE